MQARIWITGFEPFGQHLENPSKILVEQLLEKTRELAEIFWSTKGVSVKRQASNQTGGGEIVYPV